MDNNKKSTLSLSLPRGTAKNDTSGKIRQSFSHGKSKVVSVEVKKKRFVGSRPKEDINSPMYKLRKAGLTSDEVETRLNVIKQAIKDHKEQSEREEKEARVRAIELASQHKETEIDQRGAEIFNTVGTQSTKGDGSVSENQKKNDSVVGKNRDTSFSTQPVLKTPSEPVRALKNNIRPDHKRFASYKKQQDGEDDNVRLSNKKVLTVKHDIKELRGKYNAGSSRISIYNALDENEKERSLSSIKRAKKKNKLNKNDEDAPSVVREVIIPDTLSVQDLSNRMAARTGEVIKTLIKMGIMVTANQIIDADTAELIALEFGHKVKRISDSDIEIGLKKEDVPEDMVPRAPVVTIMGHVDHGKTSLLDALRKTDVALKEAGGITQGIGAYQVKMQDGRTITFIDTPGHAAFTEMRSRGANVTDIVVLVVAADDSVKDQTIEAINHANAANVPIVVAINKIDKPGANPEKARNDLLNYGIVVEKFGGQVIDVEVSAKTGKNLDKLEEAILLQADVLGLAANPNRNAEGVVIESRIEKGLGPVATVLINKGTLKAGDNFVSGIVYGRVRAIKDHTGKVLSKLIPGMPGRIIGFNGTTVPGDDFVVVENDVKAREIANYRERKKREQEWVVTSKKTIDQMFSNANDSEKLSTLSIIIKADVQGSVEAIVSSLNKLSTEEIAVKVIHSGIGEITENDVALAHASNAIIMGFNVRASMQARSQIVRGNVEVRYYSVIYDLIDAVKALLSGLLAPDIKENVIGTAEVRKVFDVSKFGRIAGCIVTDGLVRRGAKARLLRNGVVVYTGTIKSVHRGKEDVKEVRSGFECGLLLEDYSDIHVNDIIECFELEEVARRL